MCIHVLCILGCVGFAVCVRNTCFLLCAGEVIVMSTPRQDEESREPQYEEDFHSPPRS